MLMTMHDLTLAGADELVLLAGGPVVALGAATHVLTQAALRRYYGADVEVLTTSDGTLAVVPLRRGVRGGMQVL
jgi:iron complex transport system ATP-binding protein